MTTTGTNNMRFDNKMLWKELFMQLSLHMNFDKFIEANTGVEFNIHLVTKTLTNYISGEVAVIVSYLSRHACQFGL